MLADFLREFKEPNDTLQKENIWKRKIHWKQIDQKQR